MSERLSAEECAARLALLDDWRLNDDGHIERTFEYPDFLGALAFANAVGEIAERHQHHPDLHVGWGRCRVEVWTHSADGLTSLDFDLAAAIDRQDAGNRGAADSYS